MVIFFHIILIVDLILATYYGLKEKYTQAAFWMGWAIFVSIHINNR